MRYVESDKLRSVVVGKMEERMGSTIQYCGQLTELEWDMDYILGYDGVIDMTTDDATRTITVFGEIFLDPIDMPKEIDGYKVILKVAKD